MLAYLFFEPYICINIPLLKQSKTMEELSFQLSEEHLAVQEAARNFAQNELLPNVIERDNAQKFDPQLTKRMGELGFMGMMVSPEYGGGGMDTVSYAIAIEEISKVDASASVMMSVNNSLVCYGLEKYGTEEQKQKYLVPLATGEKLGAFCLSEPEAGSDATSQRTTAEDKGDYYLVNGTKNWITNGNTSGICLVIAQTHPELKHKGINCLVIEKGLCGYECGKEYYSNFLNEVFVRSCEEMKVPVQEYMDSMTKENIKKTFKEKDNKIKEIKKDKNLKSEERAKLILETEENFVLQPIQDLISIHEDKCK